MTNFPQRFCVNLKTWEEILHVLQNEVLEKRAPVKFVTIDVGEPLGTFLGHDTVVEDVLGDAEVRAVREEPVPRLPDDAVVKLPERDARKPLPQEPRDEDVVQPRGLHEDVVVQHGDLGQRQPHPRRGHVEPAGAEVGVDSARHVLGGDGPLAHHALVVGLPPGPHVPHHARTLDDVGHGAAARPRPVLGVQQRLERLHVDADVIIHLDGEPRAAAQPADRRKVSTSVVKLSVQNTNQNTTINIHILPVDPDEA